MVIILLNMVAMALEYNKMPDVMEDSLDCLNLVFVSVFTLECIMKLLALRWYYFKEPWNVFDFIVVVVSLMSKTLAPTFHAQYCNSTRQKMLFLHCTERALHCGHTPPIIGNNISSFQLIIDTVV